MSAGLKLEGFKEFNNFLKQLPAQPLRRAARGAIRASAKPVTKQIKANLKGHKHTGNLARSVTVQNRKQRNNNKVAVLVGFKKPEGNHAVLVEFGTGPRFTKAGKSTGSMPALRFFTRALDTKRREQTLILRQELKKRLEKEVSKLARQTRLRR